MSRSKKSAAAKRKSSIRMTRTESKRKPSKKTAKVVKAKTPVQPPKKSAGSNRAQGIALFKLAGRPTKEQFILVYGERGHLMTWEQRAKAGVSAKQFQAALAAKQSGR